MQKKRKKGGAGGGPDTSENPWEQLLFGNIDRQIDRHINR